MGIQNIDNIGIVVRDLEAVTQFFVDLGMTVMGTGDIEGIWSDECIGLTDARSRIAMLQTPDGNGRLELAQYQNPEVEPGLGAPPSNTLGLHRVCFQVDDIDAALEIAARHGCAPVDRVAQYEDMFRMCYIRGPEGIILMLAEPLTETATDDVRPS